jgi:hypothetical protein
MTTQDIREILSQESVSMRDVKRCRNLINWFLMHLQCKVENEKPRNRKGRCPTKAPPAKVPVPDELRAIILALAHCYHCRLGNAEQRKNYRNIH